MKLHNVQLLYTPRTSDGCHSARRSERRSPCAAVCFECLIWCSRFRGNSMSTCSVQDCSVIATFCWMRLRCNFWILCYHFFYSRSASKSGRKLSKESTKETIEKERPPWRTVIAATPPKVNKNALLKAKILDATRRALLAQKICHIGIQTEPSTTLLREQSIDVQKDLIRKMDKSMDTDGVVTIRRECPRGCKCSLFAQIVFFF